MKTLTIKISDTFASKKITINVSEEDYKKLMSMYDDELGLEFTIVK